MSFSDTDTGTGFGVRGTSAAADGVSGQSSTGRGVHGDSKRGVGVLGASRDDAGVDGQSERGVGVKGNSSDSDGVAGASKKGHGVRGRGTDRAASGVVGTHDVDGDGVAGVSKGGNGVFGQGDKGPEDGIGVFGLANPVGYGVYGYSPRGPAGVVGICDDEFGVIGLTGSDAAAILGRNMGNGIGVEGRCNNGDAVVGVSDQGTGVTAQGAKGLVARGDSLGAHIVGDIAIMAEGKASGIIATATAGTGVSGKGALAGVVGNSDYVGVMGTGNGVGIGGRLSGSGGTACVVGAGVSAQVGVSGTSEEAAGVRGISVNGAAVVGISAYPTNRGPFGFAGNFRGAVNVTGPVHKSGGGFRIDHPLAPSTMYLNHSFVESAEMKNVYDGVAVLDAQGAARVVLPKWFQVLNRDCRYQLTPIGAPAPDLHVAAEVRRGAFRIAGGTPRMRVSWQITGIRQDPWANANRIRPEEPKVAIERGRYRHPEVYGKPEHLSTAFVAAPEMLAAIKRGGGDSVARACRDVIRQTAAALDSKVERADTPATPSRTAGTSERRIPDVGSVVTRLRKRKRISRLPPAR